MKQIYFLLAAILSSYCAVAQAPNAPILLNPTDNQTGVVLDVSDQNNDGNPDNAVSFRWGAASSGSAPTNYVFYIRQGTSGQFNELNNGGAGWTGTGLRVSGLTFNSTWQWYVVARNSSGASPASATFTFTTQSQGATAVPDPATSPTPADMATGVTIDLNNSNLVSFSWVLPSGSEPVTSYEFRLGDSASNPGSLFTTTTTSTFINITNMQANTQYYWQIVPSNSVGSAANNPVWSFTTQSVGSAPPDAAINPTPADMATSVSIDYTDGDGDGFADNGVDFSWAIPSGSEPATSYEFFFDENPNNLRSLGTTANTSITVTGIDANTQYYWQIVPSNSSGSATNNPVWSFTTETATVNAPNVATNPVPADGAVDVTIDTADNDNDGNPDNAVTLSYDIPTTGDLPSRIVIYQSDDPNNLTSLGSLANNSVTLQGHAENTTYYWQAVPANAAGEANSPATWSYTTEATATIEEAALAGFKIYPNPTSDVVQVATDQVLDVFTVIDMTGKVVKIADEQQLRAKALNLSDLSDGIYIVNIRSGSDNFNVRIIKR